MSSFPFSLHRFTGPVAQIHDTSAPWMRSVAWVAVGRKRLPTEPIGTMTLTLTNVVVGSRYRIERQGDGSLATPTANAEGVAGASTVPITLDYYSSEIGRAHV